MLELPSLRGIAHQWRRVAVNPNIASAALALHDVGLITGRTDSLNAATALERGLETWLAKQTVGSGAAYSIGYRARDDGNADIQITSHGSRWLLIGKKVKAIETAHPGLGQTVLQTLGRAAGNRFPMFMPDDAFNAASWTQWGGCLDEKEVIEQYKADGEDVKTLDILTRKHFDACIPTWASRPMPLKMGKVDEIAQARSTKPAHRHVALALIAVDKVLRAQVDYKPPVEPHDAFSDESPMWPPLFILEWKDDYLYRRLLDDVDQELSESGEYREQIVSAHLQGDSATEITWFLKQCEPLFAIIRAAEALINLIGEKQ